MDYTMGQHSGPAQIEFPASRERQCVGSWPADALQDTQPSHSGHQPQ